MKSLVFPSRFPAHAGNARFEGSPFFATLRNGVLAVTLPKKPERLPRRIEIQ